MGMKQTLNLIFYSARAELQAEAERTYAGILWWIFEPVLSMVIYYTVFGLILQRGTENFVVFLCIGITTWRWMQNAVMRAASSILTGGGLMQQVYFPKIVFPSTTVLADSFKFLIVLVLLLAFLWISGCGIGIAYLALPLVLIAEALFILGVSYLVAGIVPFLPDLRIVLGHIFHLLFFLSGILFSVDHIPARLVPLFKLNPMTILIISYRRVLLHNQWPEWQYLLGVIVGSVILLVFSYKLIKRFDRIYPKICS
jgi:lipopolysaccharide transport system permease protein